MASSPVAAPSSDQSASVQHPVPENYALLGGGIFSFAFAALQISGIWWPPHLIRYMGGPALLKITHPVMYACLCLALGAATMLFGCYAFSGAGRIRRLPLLRAGLVLVTTIYLLRGLLIVRQIPLVLQHPTFIRFALFSVIALCVGAVHLAGVIRLLRHA